MLKSGKENGADHYQSCSQAEEGGHDGRSQRQWSVTRIYDLGIVAIMSLCLSSSDSQEQTDVKYLPYTLSLSVYLLVACLTWSMSLTGTCHPVWGMYM